jgi:hypothetical protein
MVPHLTDLGMESIDGDRSNSIVLNDLVIGPLRSTTLDQRISIS